MLKRVGLLAVAAIIQGGLLLGAPLLFLMWFGREWFVSPQATLIVLLALLWCMFEALFAVGAHQQEERGQHPWLPYSSGLALLALQWLVLIDVLGDVNASGRWAVAGACLCVFGIVLRCAAMVGLRRCFTSHITVSDHAQLITSGLYRYLRHPSESGLLLASLGLIMIAASPLALCWWLLIIAPLACVRMILEDALLARRWPQRFEEYREKTPAFIPVRLR